MQTPTPESNERRPARLGLAQAVLLCSFGFVTPAAISAQDAPVALPTPPLPRPRIGLVLGGGSARGIAHVGVLQWLEEHHIPVDRIAGNSTGALMGASYATGLSADRIKTLLREADWGTILRPDIPYPFRSYRRKEDDRDYSVKIEAGLRQGLKLQSGLNPGHHLGLLVSRLLLPYSDVASFDDLPIPFRCVATDLEKGETVVFDRGPIAPAVRASMSLPGTYDPVRLNGRLFTDGGVLNNIPVDVARQMGADVVIAVRTGPKREEKPSESISGVANRAITLMMQALERPRLQQAEIVILPDLEGLSGSDFRKTDELAARGYKAAESQKEALMRYALDEASWAEYRASIESRSHPTQAPITFVEVTGVSDGAGAQIARQLSRHIGLTPHSAELETDLNRVVGLGRYASATYGRRVVGDAQGLGVQIREKSYGPPFVRFSLDVNNEYKDVNLNVGSRITLMDVTGLGSELRIDTSVGSTLSVGTELYQPIGADRPVGGGAFISPRAAYTRTSESFYRGNELAAIYGRQRVGTGIDLGWNSSGATRFLAGYDIAYVENITRLGDSLPPRSTGREQAFRARFDFDGRSAPYLSTRGVRLTSSARWFLEAPDAPEPFGSVEGGLRASHPVHANHVATLNLDGGQTFGGSAPTLYQFSLGGPFRLAAFPTNAFRGPKYLLGSIGYRIPVGSLPKLFGGQIYFEMLVETGSVFEQASNAHFKSSASAGLTADTLIGPVFGGASIGDGGDVRVYFLIGRLVR